MLRIWGDAGLDGSFQNTATIIRPDQEYSRCMSSKLQLQESRNI